MNVGRAKEIAESADVIRVSYEGTPIIIQHVDETTKMARIFLKQNPDEEKEVSVFSLIEE